MAEYILDTTEGIFNARTTGEVIRCRDCEHFTTRIDARGTRYTCSNQRYFEVTPDGYCAWADRRG